MTRSSPQLFVADDKFPDVIAQLEARGWKRYPHESFPKFDFKWSNYSKIPWTRVGPRQIVNHFHNAVVLSRKDELTARLYRLHDRSVDSFFARTFDLQKQGELDHVAAWFLYYRAVGLLLQAQMKAASASATSDTSAAMAYLKRVASIDGFFTCGPTEPDLSALEVGSSEWDPLRGGDSTESSSTSIAADDIANILERIRGQDTQFDSIEAGHGNLWICKPSNLSQGRGIHLLTDLDGIVRLGAAATGDAVDEESASNSRSPWIVQKYIERPLLLQGNRKFDIRQWVLITALEPLRVRWYDRCYLRFCSQPFSLECDSIGNSFVHLSNYSVQKNAPEAVNSHTTETPQQCASMWHSSQFQEVLRRMHGRDVWSETIVPQMQRAAVTAIRAALPDMKQIGRGFEWLGIDFLVDASFHVWLLEVNVSPDVSHSTPVTAELVPDATRGILDIVLGSETAPPTTGWIEMNVDECLE